MMKLLCALSKLIEGTVYMDGLLFYDVTVE